MLLALRYIIWAAAVQHNSYSSETYCRSTIEGSFGDSTKCRLLKTWWLCSIDGWISVCGLTCFGSSLALGSIIPVLVTNWLYRKTAIAIPSVQTLRILLVDYIPYIPWYSQCCTPGCPVRCMASCRRLRWNLSLDEDIKCLPNSSTLQCPSVHMSAVFQGIHSVAYERKTRSTFLSTEALVCTSVTSNSLDPNVLGLSPPV